MSPTFRRRYGIALIAMICTAVFTLTWVAGPMVSLFLLGTGAVMVALAYLVWRFMQPTESDFSKAMREATKLSGIHPANRGRTTDSAEAAWLDNPVVLRERNPEQITAEPMDPLLRDLAREMSKSHRPANRQLAKALREFNHGVIPR